MFPKHNPRALRNKKSKKYKRKLETDLDNYTKVNLCETMFLVCASVFFISLLVLEMNT